jgi:hypothetical protein
MAAVTALGIIQRALRLIGVYGAGDTLSPEEAADSLQVLNALVDEWVNEKLMISAPSLDSIILAPGVGVYTIGPSGGTVSDYPTAIDGASYIQYGGISYPLALLTLAEYNAITLKSLSTLIPESLWYNTTFPNGTITLYPKPADVMTLNLWSWKSIATFQGLSTQVLLPKGYENALAYNLAEALAPEYSRPVPVAVLKMATLTKRKLKRTNHIQPMLSPDVGGVGSGRFNILGGRSL